MAGIVHRSIPTSPGRTEAVSPRLTSWHRGACLAEARAKRERRRSPLPGRPRCGSWVWASASQPIFWPFNCVSVSGWFQGRSRGSWPAGSVQQLPD